MIGVDTSALIDLFKGNPNLIQFLKKIEDKVVLNQISYLELMFGLDFESQSHKLEEEYYDSLFNNYPVLSLDNLSCKKAAKIFLELKSLGKLIDPFDCAIAGVLLSNQIDKILTRNKAHFEKIKELQVLSY